MVLEIAEIEITPGSAQAFTDAYRGARHLLLEAGAGSVRLLAGVESPAQFRLLVEWASPAEHRERFTSQPAWHEWRAAIGPFFAKPPLVEHYELVEVD
jgi:heme-degrading monooxygenase HmoA